MIEVNLKNIDIEEVANNKKVTKFASSAHIIIAKKHVGRKAIVLILK